MLDKIKELSQDKIVVCPVGVGSAFAKKNYNSSFIIANKGNILLFDVGVTIPLALHQKGIKVTDFDAYHISHAHADHVGGVEELLLMSRYVTKTKPLFINDSGFMGYVWNHTLSGGVADSEFPSLRLEDVTSIQPLRSIAVPDDDSIGIRDGINLFDMELEFFQTRHVPANNYDAGKSMWSNGICVNRDIFISGDTQFNPDLIEEYSMCSIMFHDCQLFDAPDENLVHATYSQLKTLPDEIKAKMYLYHYGDNFADFKPEDDGFKGFAKPWELV